MWFVEKLCNSKSCGKILSAKFCGRIERNLYVFQVSIEFIIHKAGGLFLRTKKLFLKLSLHTLSNWVLSFPATYDANFKNIK